MTAIVKFSRWTARFAAHYGLDRFPGKHGTLGQLIETDVEFHRMKCPVFVDVARLSGIEKLAKQRDWGSPWTVLSRAPHRKT